jgi:hypothetical protein
MLDTARSVAPWASAADSRVGEQERRQRRHHDGRHHRRQPGDAQHALIARAGRQLAQQLVLERALGVDEREQAAAGVGQRDLARPAHHHRGGQPLLERGDPARQRGLADVQLAGGAGEAAGAHHGGEGGELILRERLHGGRLALPCVQCMSR